MTLYGRNTMRNTLRTMLALTLAVPGGLAGQSTSLTLFQDGRVLARRTIVADIPAGTSRHQLALGALDPGSLFSLDATVRLIGTTYDAALDESNTMRRMVGRSVLFSRGYYRPENPDTVRATVLRVAPEQFRMPNGTITFQRPGTPLYPDDAIQSAATTQAQFISERPRRSLDLGYFTTGARWGATYTVLLGDRSARIDGLAAILSDALIADSAEIQLLAGNVGRASVGGGRLLLDALRSDQFRDNRVRAEAVTQESIGDVHLYTLPGQHTIRSGVTSTIPLFQPASSGYDKIYTVRGQLPYRGVLQQLGDDGVVPVQVTYLLHRAEKSVFGALPLPGGIARVYRRDAGGRLQLIGEAGTRHTAPGEDLRLPTGEAFDLTARRTETSYRTVREGNRTIAFAGYRVTVANGGDSTVTVEVLERRVGEWAVLSSSARAEKLSSTETRFRLRVPAGEEVVLTYEVRVTW